MATNRINTIEKRTAPSYIEGSPLILEAYALHEDTATGRRIAQLKWRNICQQPVRAVMAELVCYDSFKHRLESKVFTYDQLNVSPNGLFGDNQAILLPDNGTMHCEVLLKAVTYENAEVWENPSAVPFEPLPEAVPLAMEDETLLAQYARDVKLAYGFNTAKYEPAQNKGLWQCTCGSWQPEGNTCLVCGATPEALQELRNEDNLRQNLAAYEEAQERLRKEEEEKEKELKRKQEQRRKEEEERRARLAQIMAEQEAQRKKRTKIGLIVFAIIAVVVVGLLLADKFYFMPKAKYDDAVLQMNRGHYSEARGVFTEIGSFSDAEEKVKESWYLEGEELMLGSAPDYEGAKAAYTNAGDYSDAQTRFAEKCYQWGTKYLQADAPDYAAAREAFSYAGVYAPEDGSSAADLIKESWYLEGESKLAGERPDFFGAREAFANAEDYAPEEGLSAAEYIDESRYLEAVHAADNGDYGRAFVLFGKMPEYKDTADRLTALRTNFPGAVAAGYAHTVWLKPDGTVTAEGASGEGRCDTGDWTGIVAVSAGYYHTVGLKEDGTVVATKYTGNSDKNQCAVSDWQDIVAVSAGREHTVGLKTDGTVVAAGNNSNGQCDVSEWSNIVAIAAGDYHTVGLKGDGSVVMVGKSGSNMEESEWKDIIAVDAGHYYTAGLKADGTVVLCGEKAYQVDDHLEQFTNIVSISAGTYHLVGLKADGSVVVSGSNDHAQRSAQQWTDVLTVCAGGEHTVGLKADGSLVTAGWNEYGQCIGEMTPKAEGTFKTPSALGRKSAYTLFCSPEETAYELLIPFYREYDGDDETMYVGYSFVGYNGVTLYFVTPPNEKDEVAVIEYQSSWDNCTYKIYASSKSTAKTYCEQLSTQTVSLDVDIIKRYFD